MNVTLLELIILLIIFQLTYVKMSNFPIDNCIVVYIDYFVYQTDNLFLAKKKK